MYSRLILFLLIVVLAQNSNSQSLAINTTGAAADPSAIVDISTVNKGMLTPRMTVAQRNAIVNPATGLIIWCLDCDEFQVYNGIIWKNMSGYAACVTPLPPFVKICNQTWMIKNLDVDRYRNGDPIPKVTDNVTWAALTTGAYCYYNNDSATYAAAYGKLYNGYAIIDPRGLAPIGWHIPTDAEWNILIKCIDPLSDTSEPNVPSSTVGGHMKEIGFTHWAAPNTGATNRSGFTALPGGYRGANAVFSSLNFIGIWWSASEYNSSLTWYRYLANANGIILRTYAFKQTGHSVRCLRD